MDLYSILFVVFSVILNVFWNYLSKANDHKYLLLFLGQGIAGTLFIPIALIMEGGTIFSPLLIFLVLLSGILHAISLSGLAIAYEKGNLSYVFPIVRGSAILWLFLFTVTFLYESTDPVKMLGVGIVCLGTLLLGNSSVKSSVGIISISIGLSIALYSMLDKELVLKIPPLLFISLVNLATFIFMMPVAFYKHSNKISIVLRGYLFPSTLIGVGGLLTYYLILLAFKRDLAAYVLSLRQVSIIFTTFAGYLFLKEEVNLKGWICVITILVGIVLLSY